MKKTKKINKKIFRKHFFSLFFLLCLNFFPLLCLASASQYDYQIMEGIPGFFKSGDYTNFPNYIFALYKFGLWTIGVSAMFMIMVGGFMYITSAGNSSKAEQAKGIIVDALSGLFLALVSYLLLYTINPDLTKFIDIRTRP